MNRKSNSPITKRKHHHLWASYLKRWSNDGVNIHYTTAKKNLVCESIKGVAMELDFYKLCRLDDFDIKIIKTAFSASPTNLQKLHMSQLSMFLTAQGAEDLYRKLGVKNCCIEKEIEALYSNLLEDTHSLIERKARPIINALADGDMRILDNKDSMLDFMMFLGHQISRTKNFKTIAIRSFVRGEELAERMANSMTKAWWFYSYMYGMNIGASLFSCRNDDRHSLLVNNTSTAFITADQPIINVHPDLPEHQSKTPPPEADFYYPISPRIAYIICSSDSFQRGIVHVTEKVVQELNLKITKSAATNIFGDSEHILRPLIGQIGARRSFAHD